MFWAHEMKKARSGEAGEHKSGSGRALSVVLSDAGAITLFFSMQSRRFIWSRGARPSGNAAVSDGGCDRWKRWGWFMGRRLSGFTPGRIRGGGRRRETGQGEG